MKKQFTVISLLLALFTACTPEANTNQTTEQPTVTNIQVGTESHVETSKVEPTSMLERSPTTTAILAADAWMTMPIVPEGISQSMVNIYQRGLARGRDPDRFSKFGDCQSVPSLFLGIFDSGDYELGEEYDYLQPTIDHFSGLWNRVSFAVKGGLNVAAVQTLYYTDPKHCLTTESPMVCEIRVNNPSIVLISFETWWADKPVSILDDPTTSYEARLRAVIDYAISQDVVPILATKADNLEGDYGINEAIARVAYEYQIPLWNFWAATNVLPSKGLADGFHLTVARNYFDDPERMLAAWPWRNLTALQTIDAVYRGLNSLP
jgi:hypothetical protein